MDAQILAFSGVVTALVLTPGANMMLVARNVVSRGQNAGFLVTIGGCVGVLVHAAFSAMGLSIIVVQSAELFGAVKLMGALYLVYLGAQSLRHVKRKDPGRFALPEGLEMDHGPAGDRRSFVEGFTTIMLSPETSIFYLAILPQFINPGESVLRKSFLLAGIHLLARVFWYSTLTLFLTQMRRLFIHPRTQQWFELSSGIILVALGLKVAFSWH